MEVMINTIMEKHAASLAGAWQGAKNLWGAIPWVKKYRQIAASPGFKSKKFIGKAALGTTALAVPGVAALSYLDKPEAVPGPNPNMLGQTQQNTM